MRIFLVVVAGGGGGGGGIENEIEKKTCPKNISQILICFNEM